MANLTFILFSVNPFSSVFSETLQIATSSLKACEEKLLDIRQVSEQLRMKMYERENTTRQTNRVDGVEGVLKRLERSASESIRRGFGQKTQAEASLEIQRTIMIERFKSVCGAHLSYLKKKYSK